MKIKIIIIILLVYSCGPDRDIENCHKSVDLINNSNKVVYFGGRNSVSQISYNPLLSGDYFKILPGTTKRDIFGRERGCYEELFSENVDGKLYYLFFDEEVLLNNNWDEIRANDMVLKRYSFTLEEMQAANWTITYDGN